MRARRRYPIHRASDAALLVLLVLTLLYTAPPCAGAEEAPGITYVEQPTGIALADYVKVWPALESYVTRLEKQETAEVASDLRRGAAESAPSDGVLNLLAQMERQAGNLDEAERLMGRALEMNPKQHLHHFQQAMISYARLQRASGRLERWKLHSATKDAYRKAFDLDPRPIPYRYYLAYTLLQEPRLAGGDKDEALRMAQEGIDMGLVEFYVVRADIHRQRGEVAPAWADYDRSITEKIFKLNSFIAAGHLALERQELERARRYFEYAVRCRPDSPRPHEGLGDYYAAAGDTGAAARAYENALSRDQTYAPAREKLAKLDRKTDKAR